MYCFVRTHSCLSISDLFTFINTAAAQLMYYAYFRLWVGKVQKLQHFSTLHWQTSAAGIGSSFAFSPTGGINAYFMWCQIFLVFIQIFLLFSAPTSKESAIAENAILRTRMFDINYTKIICIQAASKRKSWLSCSIGYTRAAKFQTMSVGCKRTFRIQISWN